MGLGLLNKAFAGGEIQRDWSQPRFLFVGVDWERKNGAAVIDAFAQLRQEIPQTTLDVVGEHASLNTEGVRSRGRLRLDDAADRSTLEALDQASIAFVMPSIHEPFGISYLEAAISGVASIGTANGGADAAIGDGGLLVDPRSTEQLSDAMRRLAAPELAAELGARATLFTWRKVAERLVRALAPTGFDPSFLADFLYSSSGALVATDRGMPWPRCIGGSD